MLSAICFSALKSKPEKTQHKTNKPIFQPIMDLHLLAVFFVLFFSGLDSKAEGQSADHSEKMIVFSRCD